jgi:hypothetical protein
MYRRFEKPAGFSIRLDGGTNTEQDSDGKVTCCGDYCIIVLLYYYTPDIAENDFKILNMLKNKWLEVLNVFKPTKCQP